MSSKKINNSNEKIGKVSAREINEKTTDISFDNIFIKMEDKWHDSESINAYRLSDTVNRFQTGNPGKSLEKRFDLINLTVFPFHHLITAEKLYSAFITLPSSLLRPQTIGEGERRRQLFWQSLAEKDVSPKEAILFDDSIYCSFIDFINEEFVGIDWEVLYFDELQGCAEIYRAEMLSVKRQVYEAGDDLRSVLQMMNIDILQYLSLQTFILFEIDDLQRLFLDNLMAPFTLTVSKSGNLSNRIGKNTGKNKRINKPVGFANIFSTYTGYSANRIESWMSKEDDTEEKGEAFSSSPPIKSADNPVDEIELINAADEKHAIEKVRTVYQLKLANYWLNWQKDARSASFDFDFLETFEDARVMRFYELTKLLRAQIKSNSTDKIPDRLEIEYEKFILLMPLPRLNSEREIKAQIKFLLNPLKKSGYVKSFTLKPDWRGINSADLLVFRFKD